MNTQQETIDIYYQKKEEYTTEIDKLLEKLKNEVNEKLRQKFISYAIDNIGKNELVNASSQEMVLSRMDELQVPDYLHHFYSLFYAIIEKDGYDLDRDEGDGWHVLTDDENNFYSIGMSQADLFVMDSNLKNPEVKLCRHDSVPSSEDAIADLYMDNYGFWFNEETGVFNNENNLLLHKIFDEDGEYIYDSPYILKFLTGVDSGLEPLGYSYYTLVNFIILETQEKYSSFFE